MAGEEFGEKWGRVISSICQLGQTGLLPDDKVLVLFLVFFFVFFSFFVFLLLMFDEM